MGNNKKWDIVITNKSSLFNLKLDQVEWFYVLHKKRQDFFVTERKLVMNELDAQIYPIELETKETFYGKLNSSKFKRDLTSEKIYLSTDKTFTAIISL